MSATGIVPSTIQPASSDRRARNRVWNWQEIGADGLEDAFVKRLAERVMKHELARQEPLVAPPRRGGQ